VGQPSVLKTASLQEIKYAFPSTSSPGLNSYNDFQGIVTEISRDSYYAVPIFTLASPSPSLISSVYSTVGHRTQL
jgi:hypothetical protein